MAEAVSLEEVRRVLGVEVSDAEAVALASNNASQARGVAAFPQADLQRIEPALRSIPGPLL